MPILGTDGTDGFNDYAFAWRPGEIKWYVNGRLVRTATGADLLTTRANFVLTPWSGTATVDSWLGSFDTSRAPVLAEVDWEAFTRAGENLQSNHLRRHVGRPIRRSV